MFKILCISSGEYIKLERPRLAIQSALHLLVYFDWYKIDDSLDNTIYYDSNGQLWFTTRESADWFIRRRLTYNSKRTDSRKLRFMESVLTASGVQDFRTVKVEFEINEDEPSLKLTQLRR